jgi:hypothetical protein
LLEEDIDAAKPVRDAELVALIQTTEEELQPEVGTLSDEDEDIYPDYREEYDSDDDVHENALFYMEFHQHKKDYYMTKLECDTVNRWVQRVFVL